MKNYYSYFQQKGTGLIETLVITLFIGISVLALLSVQHNLSYNAQVSEEQSNATLLSINKLESLRDFQVISNTSGYTSYAGIASGTQTSTVANTTYTLTWTVTSFTSPTYKNINVTTTWTDRFGTSQSVSLTTRVAGVDPALSSQIIQVSS